MKTKVSFWKDEHSYKILDKTSKHTYESDSDDLLSNTDKSDCSEYFPETDESITSEHSVKSIDSDTAKLFPPFKKIHPKLYSLKKKIILTKTGFKNNDENSENNDEDLGNDDEIYDGDNENGNSDDDDIYKLSSPLYDSDSNDRFDRLTLLWKIQNQNNDENYLNNDENFNTENDNFDQITVDEIRSHFNDTSDETDENYYYFCYNNKIHLSAIITKNHLSAIITKYIYQKFQPIKFLCDI